MSQTTVDSAASGGQTNDQPSETRAPHAPGQQGQQGQQGGAPRRRPSRRTHSAAKVNATPASAEQPGVTPPAPQVAPHGPRAHFAGGPQTQRAQRA